MAFILTPRFAPAYQASQCNPFGFCAPASRPTYTYRVARPQPRRQQYSSFNHFFNQVDELLGEIDRESQRQAQIEAHLEAQREAHRQRQQRKRALRATFTVNQTEQGWQVDGDIQGFDQENINVEIVDESTLKISGNTHWQAEKSHPIEESVNVSSIGTAQDQTQGLAQPDNMDGVTLNEPDNESTTDTATAPASPASDTESHKSYQATVEDDFEDLGAETSSLISASSGRSTPEEPKESKGKERASDEPADAETTVASQSQPEAPVHRAQQEEDRVHGSFERTLRFPERIQADNVTASFEDGHLKITVPKAEAPQIRRIAIL